MINFKSLDIEYITGLIFGVLGFVLSILIGFISGNNFVFIVVRSLIIAVIFSLIGYACLIIIKKFVPEIYHVFTSINENQEIDINKDISDVAEHESSIENIPEASAADINSESDLKIPDMDLENQFNTLEKDKSEESQVNADGRDSAVISKNISSEKNIRYEPKIAAQAIRTMMKRDE